MHAFRQRARQFRVAAFQQQTDVTNCFLILRRSAQALDAWSKTTLDVIFEAGRGALPSISMSQVRSWNVRLIRSIRLARETRRQKWSEVERAGLSECGA